MPKNENQTGYQAELEGFNNWLEGLLSRENLTDTDGYEIYERYYQACRLQHQAMTCDRDGLFDDKQFDPAVTIKSSLKVELPDFTKNFQTLDHYIHFGLVSREHESLETAVEEMSLVESTAAQLTSTYPTFILHAIPPHSKTYKMAAEMDSRTFNDGILQKFLNATADEKEAILKALEALHKEDKSSEAISANRLRYADENTDRNFSSAVELSLAHQLSTADFFSAEGIHNLRHRGLLLDAYAKNTSTSIKDHVDRMLCRALLSNALLSNATLDNDQFREELFGLINDLLMEQRSSIFVLRELVQSHVDENEDTEAPLSRKIQILIQFFLYWERGNPPYNDDATIRNIFNLLQNQTTPDNLHSIIQKQLIEHRFREETLTKQNILHFKHYFNKITSPNQTAVSVASRGESSRELGNRLVARSTKIYSSIIESNGALKEKLLQTTFPLKRTGHSCFLEHGIRSLQKRLTPDNAEKIQLIQDWYFALKIEIPADFDIEAFFDLYNALNLKQKKTSWDNLIDIFRREPLLLDLPLCFMNLTNNGITTPRDVFTESNDLPDGFLADCAQWLEVREHRIEIRNILSTLITSDLSSEQIIKHLTHISDLSPESFESGESHQASLYSQAKLTHFAVGLIKIVVETALNDPQGTDPKKIQALLKTLQHFNITHLLGSSYNFRFESEEHDPAAGVGDFSDTNLTGESTVSEPDSHATIHIPNGLLSQTNATVAAHETKALLWAQQCLNTLEQENLWSTISPAFKAYQAHLFTNGFRIFNKHTQYGQTRAEALKANLEALHADDNSPQTTNNQLLSENTELTAYAKTTLALLHHLNNGPGNWHTNSLKTHIVASILYGNDASQEQREVISVAFETKSARSLFLKHLTHSLKLKLTQKADSTILRGAAEALWEQGYREAPKHTQAGNENTIR